jgi:hypothetical protein
MADLLTSAPAGLAAYRFTLSQRWDGTDVAEYDWSGQHFQADATNGATMKLARKLVSWRFWRRECPSN